MPMLIDGHQSAAAGDRATEEMLDGALAGVRVLALDDNADALDVLEVTLRGAGAHVRTATSGMAAMKLCEEETPDVLLCDLAMPDLDGFEVLRRMRTRFSGAGSIFPAIAISAHASADHRARSLQAGFREHLPKPYQAHALIEAIKRARPDAAPMAVAADAAAHVATTRETGEVSA
jgi:CheY-like chemotaxis protein